MRIEKEKKTSSAIVIRFKVGWGGWGGGLVKSLVIITQSFPIRWHVLFLICFFVTFGGGPFSRLCAARALPFLSHSLGASTRSRQLDEFRADQHIYIHIHTHICSVFFFFLFKRFISPLAHYLSLSPSIFLFPMLVHLQDSHYILYRGINPTRNPDLPCHACPREKQ